MLKVSILSSLLFVFLFSGAACSDKADDGQKADVGKIDADQHAEIIRDHVDPAYSSVLGADIGAQSAPESQPGKIKIGHATLGVGVIQP